MLRFCRLSESAVPPFKASRHSAGFDLSSAYDYTLPSKGKTLVETDLQIELPVGCYGRIASRSGLAFVHSVHVVAGVIDRDYRGNVCVLLFNFGDHDFQIHRGSRIAQLICEKYEDPEVIEVKNNSITERGEKGFGSSGLDFDYIK